MNIVPTSKSAQSSSVAAKPVLIRNVKRYTTTVLNSKFGEKRLKEGNPFAHAFARALTSAA